MEFVNPSALVTQAINIAIIIFVLRKFVFIPYLSYIDQEMIKREELESRLREAGSIVDGASIEASTIRKTAKEDAGKIREEAKSLASAETHAKISATEKAIEAMKQKAAMDIENDRRALESEMETKVMKVALKLNEKLFGKNEANEAFISHQMK